ncbi:hypothetical protein DL93DRAFT_2085650 [Clavulina sp. PMI_390]|nr:hypothetical protein DL93DRAFT_2085650 [Clavulina sp. PMI_390]
MLRVSLTEVCVVLSVASLVTGLYGPKVLKAVSLSTGVLSILGGWWANFSSGRRYAELCCLGWHAHI